MGQVQGRLLGLYSLLHFIFFVTYKRDQLAIVLPYTRLERLARDEHSCILGQLVIYDENVNTVPCLAANTRPGRKSFQDTNTFVTCIIKILLL